ncbi:hypothetical protein O8B93_09675 [Agrobacterium rhizogenes]|uniref:hypothetical protein n=1 Tax=Rhizobium rhizogenes TaxID=359 RepID=UPI0022B6A0CE|nr:hypothetical protein [Rhizobium rhizogenes]MCZ7447849.1 hypothetical protein [Rhizobium rhizogenes]
MAVHKSSAECVREMDIKYPRICAQRSHGAQKRAALMRGWTCSDVLRASRYARTKKHDDNCQHIIYDFLHHVLKHKHMLQKYYVCQAVAKMADRGRKRRSVVKVPTLALARIFVASLHGERKTCPIQNRSLIGYGNEVS